MTTDIDHSYSKPQLELRRLRLVESAPSDMAHSDETTDEIDQQAETDQQLLEYFDAAFTEHFGYQPSQVSPSDSKAVATYINAFLHYFANEHMQQTKATANIPMTAIPRPAIERRLVWYYDEKFGTDRRTKGPVRLQEELDFLKRKNTVANKIFIKEAEGDVYRTDIFPQLGFGVSLEASLRQRGDVLVADCAEVVLATHGDRILGLAVMAGQRAMSQRDTRRDTHNIIHWNEDDIPIDVRAEQPRYPKRPASPEQ